jgi:hypothetical protein
MRLVRWVIRMCRSYARAYEEALQSMPPEVQAEYLMRQKMLL